MVNTLQADDLLEQARAIASAIPDPEIPVITIAELGILRSVQWNDEQQTIDVTITPTYNGCPAMHQIEDDLRAQLHAHQIKSFRIITTQSPAWTTDWLTHEAREKLRDYGIAPPCVSAAQNTNITLARKLTQPLVPCPRCASLNTTETSHFASTACKALYKCLACSEPFDYFKPY